MHPLELAASAIGTAEGYYAPGNPPPKSNKNPGDLRASPLPRQKDKHGFVIFNSDAEGIAATIYQLCLFAVRGFTWKQALTAWAPPSDGNNTDLYISEFARRTGLALDAKIYDSLHIEHIP